MASENAPAGGAGGRDGAAGRRQMTALAAGMRADGVVAPFAPAGPRDGPTFEAYVDQALVPGPRPGGLVVLDRLQAHRGRAVARAVRRAGAGAWYLPPYSPDHNPIEHAWSKGNGALRAAAAQDPGGPAARGRGRDRPAPPAQLRPLRLSRHTHVQSALIDAEFGPAADHPGHGPVVGLPPAHLVPLPGRDELEGIVVRPANQRLVPAGPEVEGRPPGPAEPVGPGRIAADADQGPGGGRHPVPEWGRGVHPVPPAELVDREQLGHEARSRPGGRPTRNRPCGERRAVRVGAGDSGMMHTRRGTEKQLSNYLYLTPRPAARDIRTATECTDARVEPPPHLALPKLAQPWVCKAGAASFCDVVRFE